MSEIVVTTNTGEAFSSISGPVSFERGIAMVDPRKFLPAASASLSCQSGGRFVLYDHPQITEPIVGNLQRIVEGLDGEHTLIIDLAHVRLMSDFTEALLQRLYYPTKSDSDEAPASTKHVIFANPENGALVAMHRSLAAINRSCMVIEDSGKTPWKIGYVGKIEHHLLGIADYILRVGPTTSTDLTTYEVVNSQGDATRRLRELYELGLIERSPIVGAKGRPSFEYKSYHPYRHIDTSFRPRENYRHCRVPRVSDTRPSKKRTSGYGEQDPDEPPSDKFPIRFTEFLGRSHELSKVHQLLNQNRVVVVYGPEGIGKTRLAQIMAERMVKHYPGGRWWVNFHGVTSNVSSYINSSLFPNVDVNGVDALAGMSEKLAGRTGLFPNVDVNGVDALAGMSEKLAGRTGLLVLDNCESVQEEMKVLLPKLMASFPHLNFLLTSRHALGGEKAVEGVKEFELLLLTPADRIMIALRAGRGEKEAALQLTSAMAERFSGNPLFLERFVKLALRPGSSAVDLAHNLRNSSSYSDTARLVLDKEQHYSLLTSEERKLLYIVACLPMGCDQEMAAFVASLSHESLRKGMNTLIDNRLIYEEMVGSSSRFRMHETFQSPTVTWLEQHQSQELAAIRLRTATYFSTLLEGITSHARMTDERRWMPYLIAQLPNVEAILRWCASAPGDSERIWQGLQLANRFARVWSVTGRAAIGHELLASLSRE